MWLYSCTALKGVLMFKDPNRGWVSSSTTTVILSGIGQPTDAVGNYRQMLLITHTQKTWLPSRPCLTKQPPNSASPPKSTGLYEGVMNGLSKDEIKKGETAWGRYVDGCYDMTCCTRISSTDLGLKATSLIAN